MKKSDSTLLMLAFLLLTNAAMSQSDQASSTESGRSTAPVDLTGTWVAVVTEDWMWRMVTPLIGDFTNIPVNDASREIAMQWRPENDIGNECLGYGAPAIMSEPGRLRISWQDDNTLEMEIDSGMQTRLFHFGTNATQGEPSRQGYTIAHWSRGIENPSGSSLGTRGGFGDEGRTLTAQTSNLTPGYLRKNGIPHSDQATVTEYIEVIDLADGYTWLIDTIVVEDPLYLTTPWVVSRNFRKEPDDSKWSPQECFVTQ